MNQYQLARQRDMLAQQQDQLAQQQDLGIMKFISKCTTVLGIYRYNDKIKPFKFVQPDNLIPFYLNDLNEKYLKMYPGFPVMDIAPLVTNELYDSNIKGKDKLLLIHLTGYSLSFIVVCNYTIQSFKKAIERYYPTTQFSLIKPAPGSASSPDL